VSSPNAKINDAFEALMWLWNYKLLLLWY